MKNILTVSILVLLMLYPNTCNSATYYIDYSSGADTNNGTAKITPWKHAPGMVGCSDNCLTKQGAGGSPGDSFILKGGITWTKEALPWDWTYGDGTSENPIYFGVDLTWYSGASWTRPILDAQSSAITPSVGGYKGMLRVYGVGDGYFVIDNMEFTGLVQLDDTGGPGALYVQSSAFEVKNCYFHGWSHGGNATLEEVGLIGSTLISEGADLNSSVHNNVIDGSDTTKDMAMFYKGSAGHVYNNYVSYVSNGVVCNALYVWGNTFKDIAATPSFDTSCHSNAIENTGGQSIYYNNYISGSSGGATIFTTAQDGDVDYVFNNVIVSDLNQSIQIDNNGLTTGVGSGIYVFNNTLNSPQGYTQQLIDGPIRVGYPNLTFMEVRNNHLIANNPTVNFGTKVTTETESNTLGQTNAQATSGGYVSTGTYPYYPPAGGSTVNVGYAITSVCSELSDSSPSLAATACLSDTTLGVSYNATTHTVTGNGRTSIMRGDTWDIGAYEYDPSKALKQTLSGSRSGGALR